MTTLGFSHGAVIPVESKIKDEDRDFVTLRIMADLEAIRRNRQVIIDKNLLKANASRISHDHKVDEMVLKKKYLGLSDKLQPAFEGPYKIPQVHTNGTVTLRLSPHQTERINIRRVKPYKQ